MGQWLALIEPSDFEVCCERDMTYALNGCLDQWIQRAQNRLIRGESTFQVHDLVYQYPQLKSHQIEFYLEHHTPGHFYTIEQFIKYNDVCYETGRSALEQLVQLGFYQKLKQGKKFVYTAR